MSCQDTVFSSAHFKIVVNSVPLSVDLRRKSPDVQSSITVKSRNFRETPKLSETKSKGKGALTHEAEGIGIPVLRAPLPTAPSLHRKPVLAMDAIERSALPKVPRTFSFRRLYI